MSSDSAGPDIHVPVVDVMDRVRRTGDYRELDRLSGLNCSEWTSADRSSYRRALGNERAAYQARADGVLPL